MYLPVEPGRLIEGPENRGCTVLLYWIVVVGGDTDRACK